MEEKFQSPEVVQLSICSGMESNWRLEFGGATEDKSFKNLETTLFWTQ